MKRHLECACEQEGPAGKRATLFRKRALSVCCLPGTICVHTHKCIIIQSFLYGIYMGQILTDQDNMGRMFSVTLAR